VILYVTFPMKQQHEDYQSLMIIHFFVVKQNL